ncbi:hypothetical protein KR018_012372 [Drosophila ironensis]|nr:hypothetical protein KR018_012372 [Drosophila ironensis]
MDSDRIYDRYLKTRMRLRYRSCGGEDNDLRSSAGCTFAEGNPTKCDCQKMAELCSLSEPCSDSCTSNTEPKPNVSFSVPVASNISSLFQPLRNCLKCNATSRSSSPQNKKFDSNLLNLSCNARPTITVPSCQEADKKCSQKKSAKCKERKTTTAPLNPAMCRSCPTMREMSQELSDLKDKLEKLQCKDLDEIRQQLGSLQTLVPVVTDLTSQFCDLRQRFDEVQCRGFGEIRQMMECLNGQIQTINEKLNTGCTSCCPSVQRKSSSICRFCGGEEYPILDSCQRQLAAAIGKSCLSDLVISIYLRADNIYHINVRDISTGSSLGCFLVTNDGIEEARQLGFFENILTFCVIDLRNTLEPRETPLGITFEFMPPGRESGGNELKKKRISMEDKPFAARLLGLPLNKMKHVYLKTGSN